MRGLLRRGATPVDLASGFLDSYFQLPLERHPHGPLLGRIVSLWANFTAYDAVYVALAEDLGAALVTLDGRLARATRAHTSLEVVGP